ncbi:MAG: glucokinase [Anaerohalosphaeraceae bacterium]|nr:glucokinase [Anaerohalosphaeraceae bacterium]
MQWHWIKKDCSFQRLILASDVGGTNTNFALVAQDGKNFDIIVKCNMKTADISDYTACIETVLTEIIQKTPQLKPHLCCVSAAGPIQNASCTLSSTKLNIDAEKIEKRIGIKTLLINDFLALSYSLPLIDINNSALITTLSCPDGTFASPKGNIRAIAGAGTGMGVGILMKKDDRYMALPSEGGHIPFPSFDHETRQLCEYMVQQHGEFLEAEMVVSGKGIISIYQYFRDVKKMVPDSIAQEIEKAPKEERSALISQYAQTDQSCRDIIKLFVKCYANSAASIASVVIPTMGFYLAGGIVTKNEQFFIEDNCFMTYFAQHCHPIIKCLLESMPVYIIRDYSVSLLGAANAACNIMI